MKLSLRHVGLTDTGRVRRQNEDNWTADVEQGLYIVADGMGGEFAGALASKAVIATLPELVRQSFAGMDGLPRFRAGRQMAKAIATLSTQLRRQTQNEPGMTGMGSTVVCALVRGAQALVAHMGDSRAYGLRSGRLKQITRDHTLVQLLLDSGEITPEEAVDHPSRGQLTRNVGMEGEPLPQVRMLMFKPGDLLLLCTDGLTGMISDQQIRSILRKPASLESRCQSLVDSANQAGGEDNITVLLLAFEGTEE
jgi:PPM family protein phosphatase